MDLQNKQGGRRNSKEISYDFKISVLREIANGQISTNFASKKYNISRSTLEYWKKKLTNKDMAKKQHSANDEIKRLKRKIEDLEGITDFQKELIKEFEIEMGKQAAKKLLPERYVLTMKEKIKNLR